MFKKQKNLNFIFTSLFLNYIISWENFENIIIRFYFQKYYRYKFNFTFIG